MSARTRTSSVLIACLSFAGCTRESAPPPPIADRPPPAVGTPTASAPVTLLPPLPPIAQHPPFCEVEVFGRVKGASGAVPPTVFLSDEDCLSPAAHVLGASPTAKDGVFRVEVFARWGSDLSICAAMLPADGRAATRYGKATGIFHAEKLGEVVFQDVEITLAPGAPKTFARPGGPAAPSAGVPHGAP